MRTLSLTLLGLAIAAGCSSRFEDADAQGDELASGIDVTTQHNDSARTGAVANERILTPSNVTKATFGKLFSRSLDGQVYAQPLYVGGVGGKNVVYVATEHNSVYAFDADADHDSLWHAHLGPAVPASDTQCGVITPEIGITSTPVIDLAAKTIFVSAKTKENGHFIHRLHALDLATGKEKPNSPVVITASARTKSGAVVTMDPLKHMNRPGLLLSNGTLYLGFASHCDGDPYKGWIVAYDAASLRQKAVHVDTPDGSRGGVWHGGVGLGADAKGDVYYVSGNGTFDGATNFGESIVKLHPTSSALQVATSFTPFDFQQLNDEDLDIGSTGALLIPGTNSLVAGGKTGIYYVVDRDRMGGVVANDAQIVQKFRGTTGPAFGGPAFFGASLYLWGVNDVLKAFHFDGKKFGTSPKVHANVHAGYPGGQISVSANGTSAGIVWAVRPDPNGSGAGFLHALDASDISRELWNSTQNGRDGLGKAAKFAPPTIANGKVYVGTSSNELVVYGLTRGGGGADGGVDAGGADGSGGDASHGPPTFTDVFDTLLGPNTPGHCTNAGCHQNTHAGFRCGRTKDECYQGLLDKGLVTPDDPSDSPLGQKDVSPLAWFGGPMPADNPVPNPAAAAKITAWLQAGAKND
jgi:PQQ-like domain